jgi:hypothetical protein
MVELVLSKEPPLVVFLGGCCVVLEPLAVVLFSLELSRIPTGLFLVMDVLLLPNLAPLCTINLLRPLDGAFAPPLLSY